MDREDINNLRRMGRRKMEAEGHMKAERLINFRDLAVWCETWDDG